MAVVYLVAAADCRPDDLTEKGWSTALECKAWHLSLVLYIFVEYPFISYMWPCENKLARFRQRQFAYECWTP